MKAAILYEANKPLQVVDVEQQGPQAGEARVRVMATGICHSDWHIMNGDWPLPLPMVLGHEAAGVVERVGAGVANVKPGDHIIFSFRPHCGHCLYCSTGRSILCDGHQSVRWALLDGTCRLKRNGQDVFQMARIGTFCEYVVCPAEMLVPIRKDMPWAQAALMGCCVPTGLGATPCLAALAARSVRAPFTPYLMALQEKSIKGTMYGSVRPNVDFPRLVDLYLDGRLKIDQLISRTYKLDEINEGFQALRSGQVARGVVVFS